MTAAPLGPWCPGCGELARLLLPGQEMAMCGNTADCNVIMWNMGHTAEEALASVHVVDLRGWL